METDKTLKQDSTELRKLQKTNRKLILKFVVFKDIISIIQIKEFIKNAITDIVEEFNPNLQQKSFNRPLNYSIIQTTS